MSISGHIASRIEAKKSDYMAYGFSRVESNALKTFFDLAQEFEIIEDIYQLSVGIPRLFFNLHARLYIIGFPEDRLRLVAKSEDDHEALGTPPPSGIRPEGTPYREGDSMVLTIHGNRQLIKELPLSGENVIGLLEIYPCDKLDLHGQLFFEKYANRIGFNVHMRFLLKKYGEHVAFIKGLVGDIEHNVIVPNMVYKLFLKRLSGKIKKNKEIEEAIHAYFSAPEAGEGNIAPILAELDEVNRGLAEELDNIEKHYRATSLFLETLLRKRHFDEGRLTLRTDSCDINKAVIIPQYERFADQFAQKGVSVNEGCGGIPQDDQPVVIDVGLISQVYANLFSNALKYVGAVTGQDGRAHKAICYGRENLNDYFGPGKNGIKYNVFTTGNHIPEQERGKIFDEGYRGMGAAGRPGTGHGLAFVKNAVELHGGVAGYEAVPDGNNFYFILPE